MEMYGKGIKHDDLQVRRPACNFVQETTRNQLCTCADGTFRTNTVQILSMILLSFAKGFFVLQENPTYFLWNKLLHNCKNPFEFAKYKEKEKKKWVKKKQTAKKY